jgi:hypothetical protein
MDNKTSDLLAVRLAPRRFMWGTVVKIHDVGDRYTLVEYMYAPISNGKETATMFHVYVDGHSTNCNSATLDGALLIAIARARLGSNEAHYMAGGAAKLLGVRF